MGMSVDEGRSKVLHARSAAHLLLLLLLLHFLGTYSTSSATDQLLSWTQKVCLFCSPARARAGRRGAAIPDGLAELSEFKLIQENRDHTTQQKAQTKGAAEKRYAGHIAAAHNTSPTVCSHSLDK